MSAIHIRDNAILLPGLPTIPIKRLSLTKRLAVRVDPVTGKAQITAPLQADTATIAAFVLSRESKIRTAILTVDAQKPSNILENVPYQGLQLCPVVDPTTASFRVEGGILWTPPKQLSTSGLLRWLRSEALQSGQSAVFSHAITLEKHVRSIRINDMRRRWGSCDGMGNITLSWRLIMAPPWVLDYVAAHEAAHLVHMHHRDPFWSVCDRLTPHRAKATDWLSTYGLWLMRIGR